MADGQQSLEGLIGTIEARTVQPLHEFCGEEDSLVYTAGSPDDCPVSRLPLQGNAHTSRQHVGGESSYVLQGVSPVGPVDRLQSAEAQDWLGCRPEVSYVLALLPVDWSVLLCQPHKPAVPFTASGLPSPAERLLPGLAHNCTHCEGLCRLPGG